jgi:putative membrane protein
MAWIIRFVLNVIVVLGFSYLFDKGFPIHGIGQAAVFIVILTLLNWTLIPILKFMTFPLNILTLGLIGILINGLAVVLAGTVLNVKIDYLIALLFSFVLGIINGVAENSVG